MNAFEAVTRVEISPEDYTETEQLEAWQWLHDSRVGYQLQGWYGRNLQALLNAGLITP